MGKNTRKKGPPFTSHDCQMDPLSVDEVLIGSVKGATRSLERSQGVLKAQKEVLDQIENRLTKRVLDPVFVDLIEVLDAIKALVDRLESEEADRLLGFKVQIENILYQNDVLVIDQSGVEFNQKVHKVVDVVSGSARMVTDVRKPGYVLNGRVLRPAEVVITREKGDE